MVNIEVELKAGVELPANAAGVIKIRNQDKPRKVNAPPFSVRLKEGGEENGAVAPAAIVGAADFTLAPIAPGQIVSIFGFQVGPAELSVFELDPETGRIPSELSQSAVEVLFNGLPAPILSAVEQQTNVIVPTGVAGDSVEVIVVNEGRLSVPFPVALGRVAPGLFSLSQDGTGQAAAVNSDGSVNGPGNGAALGAVVVLFGSGVPYDQELEDGEIIGPENPPAHAFPVKVTIGGEEAEVLYLGAAPMLVSGVGQWNVRISGSLKPGVHSVVLESEGIQSSPNVTIVVE